MKVVSGVYASSKAERWTTQLHSAWKNETEGKKQNESCLVEF